MPPPGGEGIAVRPNICVTSAYPCLSGHSKDRSQTRQAASPALCIGALLLQRQVRSLFPQGLPQPPPDAISVADGGPRQMSRVTLFLAMPLSHKIR